MANKLTEKQILRQLVGIANRARDLKDLVDDLASYKASELSHDDVHGRLMKSNLKSAVGLLGNVEDAIWRASISMDGVGT